ncbi:MAG: serine/threonine-protein kinase [Cyanobacteriota bacterium]
MSLCINPNCPNPNNSDTQLFCNSCSSELLLEGRYRVMRQMGSGGFGKTYEVSDYVEQSANRNNSLKVLKILTNNDPKYVELFQREAQVLYRLKHHGIPRVEANAYFLFFPRNRQEPLHCLVMEKIEGLNLEQYLQQRGNPIDQKLARQWLIQLLTILQEVHNQNFFHRDIKPSNIMLRVDGQLVLIDFGTAREVTATYVTKQGAGEITRVMSAGYTPPEQINGQAVPQSDFFALGRTFVYLLTCKDPSNFYNAYTDELHWHNAALNASPQLADLLDCMMARFPHQRPQSAREILQQLEQISADTYIPKIHSQPTKPVSSPGKETEEFRLNPSPRGQQYQQYPTTQPAASKTPTPTADTISSLAPTTPPPTESQLAPDFIERCQQELAEYIGPIASIICKRTLAQNPNLSATQFIEALAQKISNSQQALEFQQRLRS